MLSEQGDSGSAQPYKSVEMISEVDLLCGVSLQKHSEREREREQEEICPQDWLH